MPKGKKTRKKRPGMPPLSLVDRVIYAVLGAGMLIIWAGFALWLCLAMPMPGWFETDAVIACRVHASRLWALPFFISLSVTFLGLWSGTYGEKRPIFGIKGFLYGPPLPKIYPLFMKNKPPKKPRDRAAQRMIVGLVLGINLLMLSVFPLSLNGRDEWHPDGSVRDVNMFGRVAAEYEASDAGTVILGSEGHARGKGWRRHVWLNLKVEIVMKDGERYAFEFGDSDSVRELESVLVHYRAISPDPATDLDRLASDMDLDAGAEKILRRLFGLE